MRSALFLLLTGLLLSVSSFAQERDLNAKRREFLEQQRRAEEKLAAEIFQEHQKKQPEVIAEERRKTLARINEVLGAMRGSAHYVDRYFIGDEKEHTEAWMRWDELQFNPTNQTYTLAKTSLIEKKYRREEQSPRDKQKAFDRLLRERKNRKDVEVTIFEGIRFDRLVKLGANSKHSYRNDPPHRDKKRMSAGAIGHIPLEFSVKFPSKIQRGTLLTSLDQRQDLEPRAGEASSLLLILFSGTDEDYATLRECFLYLQELDQRIPAD